MGTTTNFGADLICDNNGSVNAIAIELIGKYKTFQKNGCVSIKIRWVGIMKFSPKNNNPPMIKNTSLNLIQDFGLTKET